jgi:hypothetical protein
MHSCVCIVCVYMCVNFRLTQTLSTYKLTPSLLTHTHTHTHTIGLTCSAFVNAPKTLARTKSSTTSRYGVSVRVSVSVFVLCHLVILLVCEIDSLTFSFTHTTYTNTNTHSLTHRSVVSAETSCRSSLLWSTITSPTACTWPRTTTSTSSGLEGRTPLCVCVCV